MKIILFSKNEEIASLIKERLSPIAINITLSMNSSFSQLGKSLVDGHDLLIFHLNAGEQEETQFYQFLTIYQENTKVLVLTNSPNDSQGMRIYRSGVRGYANTFISDEKLELAILTIKNGEIWAGSTVLKKLKECGLNLPAKTYREKMAKKSPNNINKVPDSHSETKGLLPSIIKSISKIFSK